MKNISDDIIVFGKDQDEHDRRLEATFLRLKENNHTLNKDKWEFNKDNLELYGNVFSANGISPSPNKVSAIKNMHTLKFIRGT